VEDVFFFFFFFCTPVTGPRRSLILKLSDSRVCEPQIRARLGTNAHIWEGCITSEDSAEVEDVEEVGHLGV